MTENSILRRKLHKTSSKTRIALFGVGYEKYWNQFPGLLDELQLKQNKLREKLSRSGAEITDFGIIDSPSKAYETVGRIVASNPDLVFCDMLTYATSGTVGIIIKSLDVPLVLVALQPSKAMDYSKASTYMQLYNDDICSLPEFAGVAARMGKKIPEVIIGTLNDDYESDRELEEYCRIADVLHSLKNAQLGHIGHPINAMLDMHTDHTMITSWFGSHIVQCEADQLVKCYTEATEKEIIAAEKEILVFF